MSNPKGKRVLQKGRLRKAGIRKEGQTSLCGSVKPGTWQSVKRPQVLFSLFHSSKILPLPNSPILPYVRNLVTYTFVWDRETASENGKVEMKDPVLPS